MLNSTDRSLGKIVLAALPAAALVGFFALLPTPEGGGAASADRELPAGTSFAVAGARVFDGERMLPAGTTVLVVDGRIAAVGSDVVVPEGTPVVEGAGRTLLPGLIDAHVHAWGSALEDALRLGVTTELDMFTDPAWAAERRGEQAAGAAGGRADLFSAGVLATAPGGHGTQYGLEVPAIEAGTDLAAWVAARRAEGSDWIKVVLEDGATVGGTLPTLSRAQVAGIVEAAHAQGLAVVAHVGSHASAGTAVAAGVDGLAHLFLDEPADPELVAAAREAGVFVVPTLSVLASVAGGDAAELAGDERVAPYLTADQRASLRRSFPRREATAGKLGNAAESVRRFAAAGVPVLAGSDAPNPGTAHGASLHGELALLVGAGLTPSAALTAATAAPARAFGLDDRGRIAPGLRADLVLVAGDPTETVEATRELVAVWKGGRLAAREPVGAAGAAAAPRVAAGPVSDFADGPGSRFGGDWFPSTDEMRQGRSTVELTVEDGGLTVAGEIRPGFPFPWAGAMVFAGPAPMAAADASAARAIALRARADHPFRLMVFSEDLGPVPVSVTLPASGEWRRHEVPFADFGIDGSRLQAVLVTGGPEQGPFEIRLDDVELVPEDGGEGGGGGGRGRR